MQFISGQTNATGTVWNTLTAGAARSVDILNATGTTLAFRRAADTTPVMLLPTGIGFRFALQASLSELQYKRNDDSNSQVTFYGDAAP